MAGSEDLTLNGERRIFWPTAPVAATKSSACLSRAGAKDEATPCPPGQAAWARAVAGLNGQTGSKRRRAGSCVRVGDDDLDAVSSCGVHSGVTGRSGGVWR